MQDKLQVALSDGQIEQLKNLTPRERNKLGFSCYFPARRVQIFTDIRDAVGWGVTKPVYTFEEFTKKVECLDQRELRETLKAEYMRMCSLSYPSVGVI